VGSDADSLQEVAGLSGAKLRNAEYSAAAEVAIAMKQADDLQAFRVAKRKGRGKNTRGTHLEVAGMQVPFGHALIVTADEAAKLQDADLGDYEWHAE
jgi:hypothetical protein